jgi:ubiquitin
MANEPQGETPQATPPATSTTPEQATTPPANPPAENAPTGENEASKFRRLFEKAEKEREALAAKIKEQEDAKLSELEKATNRAKELEDQLNKERTERLRLKIATESGLSPEDMDFVVGSDEETMRTSAQRLAARIGAAPKAAGTVTNPPSPQAPSIDERIAAAERSGNRMEAIRLKRERAFGQ